MKTLPFLISLLLIPCCINAQTWQWTHPEPNGVYQDNYDLEDDYAFKVVADTNANVYELGIYHDSLYLSNHLQTAGSNGTFIAKYNANGKLLWHIQPKLTSGNAGEIEITDISASSKGIFITGDFSPSATGFGQPCDNPGSNTIYSYSIGSYHFTSDVGDGGLFVAKLDFNGKVVWFKKANALKTQYDQDNNPIHCYTAGAVEGGTPMLAADKANNVITTFSWGTGGGYIDFGNTYNFTINNDLITVPWDLSKEYVEMITVKYDDAGNLQWYNYALNDNAVNFQLSGENNCNSMIADNKGNTFLYCRLNDSCKLGNITFHTTGIYNAYTNKYFTQGVLVKLDAGGNWDFAKEIVNIDDGETKYAGASPQRLATDDLNNVYILSNVGNGGVIAGDTLLYSIGDSKPFLVKCDNSGNVLWHKNFGGSLGGTIEAISYANKQLYISGYIDYSGDIYYNFSNLTVPNTDGIHGNGYYTVAKADTSGKFTWVSMFSGQNIIWNLSNCAVGSSIYSCGYYNQSITGLGNLNGASGNSIFNLFLGKIVDQYIKVDAVTPTALCPGSNVTIPFTSYGLVFTNKNKFTAEISDANGDFTTPTVIGSVKSKGTGSIVATIPSTLPYGNDYRVRIRSSDTLKTGYNYFAYADTDYKITLLCPAPSSGFTAIHITGTSATVKWNVVDCAKGYRVQYKIKGTSKWTTITTNTNTDSLKLNGLTANTTYQWRVATKCKSSVIVYSAYSAIKQFTTAALFAISGVDASAISLTNSLQLMVQPNPATTSAILVVNGNIKSASITITDLLGKTLWEKDDVNSNHILLPVEKFASGVYIVKLASGNEKSMVKFVKE